MLARKRLDPTAYMSSRRKQKQIHRIMQHTTATSELLTDFRGAGVEEKSIGGQFHVSLY